MTRQESYNREELLACGHGELFGEGNARLPLPNMLMMDRITKISEENHDTIGMVVIDEKGQMVSHILYEKSVISD